MHITNTTKTKIDTKFLQKAAQAAFAVLHTKKDISLVFIGDAKMKELNKKYRHKNKTTDVLSFEEVDEIFISLPVAKKQAKLLKTSLKVELTRLLTHGIVHLNGYDHEKSTREAEAMFAVETKILDKINEN
jgi:probable rRNA maturation factor